MGTQTSKTTADALRALGDNDQSASYCCQAAGAINAADLPAEQAF
ncbi:MAG TPA: hypothetical protein VMQ44_01035 [Candidatus Saccharimonadales bacterium]|nr:hypothetical protein [Candidatus Saccharimonadales bacterium]